MPRKPGKEVRGHWTDGETWALVDAWGPLYLRRAGGSLSVDDWRAVSSAVHNRSAIQCQKRVYALKYQYKKELSKQGPSQWRHFSRLSAFLASPPPGFSAKVTPATTTVNKEKEEEEKEEVGPPPGFLDKMPAKTVKKELEEEEVGGCGCEKFVGRKRPRNLAAAAGCSQCPAAVVTKLAEVYERVAVATLSVEKEKMICCKGAVKVEIAEETDDKLAAE